MTIVFNNIKRILRVRSNYLTMIILPIVFIAFSLFGLGNNSSLTIGFIDNDNTDFTKHIEQSLKKDYKVLQLNENDIQNQLLKNKIQFAVKLDQGFTEQLIAGADVLAKTYSIQETNATMPVKHYLVSLINAAKNIAAGSSGDGNLFKEAFEAYKQGSFKAEYSYLENTGTQKEKTRQSFGFIIMFMLFLSTNASFLILEDKRLKTYGRVLSSPVSQLTYMLQNILSFTIIMAIQLACIFGVLRLVFKADLGTSPMNLLAFTLVFALTCVALGIAISNLSKDIRQANSISTLIVVPLCMIGGCFWPREIMPGLLREIARFNPVSWALDGVNKLLYGTSFLGVSAELAALLGCAVLLFLIGASKGLTANSIE